MCSGSSWNAKLKRLVLVVQCVCVIVWGEGMVVKWNCICVELSKPVRPVH